jgi:hypothetical protein
MKCPDAIGVVTRTNPLSIIPIEFCRLPQQMYKKVLDPAVMKDVLKMATKNPADRFRAIESARVRSLACSFLTRAHPPKVECAGTMPRSGLNSEISPRPMDIAARRLPPLGITFGENRTESAVRFLSPEVDRALMR